MQNLWNDAEAAKHPGDLGEITYGSRLVGSDPALVLHGGGNTSIKSIATDAHGEAIELLYVKGSGWDLATIEPPGFAPLRLESVRRLAELPELSDTEMVNQLRINLMDASAPNPSVEAILHACLPYKSVLHTHADAVLALTNTSDGANQVKAVWGDRVVIIDYVMPGFDLARVCAEEFAKQSHSGTEAMVLLNHGIFTFSDTTRSAYDSMIRLITEAENYLAEYQSESFGSAGSSGETGSSELPGLANDQAVAMADLRAQISAAAGKPMLLSRTGGAPGAAAIKFCQQPDLASLATRGPATPDHIIRTKQFPLVLSDLAQTGSVQTGSAQTGSTQAGSTQAGSAQAGSAQADPTGTSPAQTGSTQTSSTQASPAGAGRADDAQTNSSIGRSVASFVDDYAAYFSRNQQRRNTQDAKQSNSQNNGQSSNQQSNQNNQTNQADAQLTMLDPAPRVVLTAELGLLTAGKSFTDCKIASDIYVHTISVIEAAEALDEYVALPEADLFDVEYWELEQAKLRRGASASGTNSADLTGQVALVTGAASGIGKAVAQALAAQGAAVVGLDIDPSIETSQAKPSNQLGLATDVTNPAEVEAALKTVIETFGGIDIVVAAAGIFGASEPIAELDPTQWQRTLDINLSAVANTLQQTHRYLRLSPVGGRVVLVGSKNVSAPGTSAAAYSASKAGVVQLGRVAALEWAADNITVNTVHPDAIFDTGLWSDELIEQRASSYGISAEQYRRRNLLSREITSADVGQLVVQLCSPAFAATTGAQIAIDGGSDRVI